MASRLYPTTRRLFWQVVKALRQLGLGAALSPLGFSLLALYVAGLILLDRRQTPWRIADWLSARAHDALNRFLRTMPLQTRPLMGQLISFAKRLKLTGYLILDDVVVEKPFSFHIPWVGWTYSASQKRKVRGLHIVILLWCVGIWRIPVAFRLWCPKASCSKRRYRTKGQLAWEMVVEVVNQGLPIEYVVFDTFYTAGWLTKRLSRLGLVWQGVLHPKTRVCWRRRDWSAIDLADWWHLRWRAQLGLRARSLVAYLPKYGTLRLDFGELSRAVVTRNRHGNLEVLATNDLGSDLTTIVRRKRSRWSAETLFRDAKQLSGPSG